MKAKVGDWVRFYRGGLFVIGVVEYMNEKDVLGKEQYATDNGAVNETCIQEVRKK